MARDPYLVVCGLPGYQAPPVPPIYTALRSITPSHWGGGGLETKQGNQDPALFENLTNDAFA